MDELPELLSDADVDALMARLRAKVAPPPDAAPAIEPLTRPPTSDDAVRDLVAAQDTLAATVVRAMQLMVETLEDLEPEVQHSSTAARSRGRRPQVATPRRRVRRKAR